MTKRKYKTPEQPLPLSAETASKTGGKRNLYYQDEQINEKFSFSMFKKLLSYASKYRKTYILVIALFFLGSAAALTPTALMAVIVNRVLPENGVLPSGYLTTAIVVVSAVVCIYLFNCIGNYFKTLISHTLGNKVIYDLRRDIFEKLLSLDFNYFDSRPTGKILVRATSYTDQIADIFVYRLVHILYNTSIMAICLVVVFALDYRLGGLVLAAVIPLTVLLFFVARIVGRRARADRNKNSNLTAFVTENINGREIVKAFNRQQLNSDIQTDLTEQHLKAFMHTTRAREAFFPLAHGAIQMVCIILIYLASLFIIQSVPSMTLTLGAIVSITTYMQTFSEALRETCQSLESVSTLTTNCERIFEILGTGPEVKEKETATALKDCKGAVRFDNVLFSYDGKTNILENFSLDVAPGQSIALIGPTGAGKTTIINLLSRFYNINGGRILIDGTDIEDFTLNSLRKNVGVMMQDSFLFSGTVKENISFSLDADEERCIRAAQFVGADEFIKRLPQGYDTVIDNACELSSGERQLISFARLIYSDPKIVILDEATSNIDTKTEAKLQAALRDFLKSRTSFVIAHRLSTIRNSDKIVYIDNKNIAESGTHDELMKLKGKYYKLISSGH